MAKNNTPEVKPEQKVQTKYDRKMEARRQQKLKDARQEKMMKTIGVMLGVVVLIAIVVSIAVPIVRKNVALRGTYVKVGDHELTQLEYDYYYNVAVNNYLTAYASILPYMGLDTSRDYAQQQYAENRTWKDLFDEMTVEQIRQSKALLDDANAAGFTYDTSADYESFVSEFETAAQSAGVSASEYYKNNFGTYATKQNMEPFVKEGLFVSAYHDDLLAQNAPSEEEIKSYYEENKQNYDKVDYRSFNFNTELAEDASEEDIGNAMDELKEKAEAMMEARKDGEDFEALCLENASENTKENYEDPDTEYSLSEGRSYSSISAVMSDWLYDESRKAGDITVLADETYHQYYVVEFVNRYYDEADDANIADTLASQSVSEYTNGLLENYQVTDVKGNLKYLTISTEESATDRADEEGTETDADSAAGVENSGEEDSDTEGAQAEDTDEETLDETDTEAEN